MKRLTLCLILLAALLAGCGGAPVPTTAPTAAPTEADTIYATVPVEAEWIPETTAPAGETEADGYLFLSVSRLDFSLVGESEDVYLGTLPREDVIFESQDPAVVTFENGVLTATGVGSTNVVARYGYKYITCQVSCLAETQEDLNALPEEILRSAKRYPPVMGDATMDYFADTALVGDSISQILFQWETMYDYLGEVLFLVRGGTGLNGVVLNYKPVYYKGREVRVEDALADAGCKKVFLMLGQNDLRYREIEDCMESWEILLASIREKNPGIEVHIQSVIPEWIHTLGSNANNEKIAEFNEKVKVFAAENDCRYVDIASYAVDHTGRMPSTYELDRSIHMNYDGCYAWIQVLKAYAFLQQ